MGLLSDGTLDALRQPLGCCSAACESLAGAMWAEWKERQPK